jgi:hypothetical protein
MLKEYDDCFWLLVDEELIEKFEDIELSESESMRLASISAHLHRISEVLGNALAILVLKFPIDTPLEDPAIQRVKRIIDDVVDELWHFELRIKDNCPQIKVNNCHDHHDSSAFK